MSTKCEWIKNGRWQRFFDPARGYQTIDCMSPAKFVDDFRGTATLLDGTTIWSVVDVSAAGDAAPARIADGENGVVEIKMANNDEAEDSVLYWGDERGINVKDGCIYEMRLTPHVLPTLAVDCVFGLAGDHNLDKDTVTEAVWFKLDGSGVLVCESDDTTNNNDDVATGITLVADTYYNFRIDTTDNTNVKFFVDGVRVGSATTFDISNLSDAEGIMQPYFSLDKASGAGVGTLYIDRVGAWWNRA